MKKISYFIIFGLSIMGFNANAVADEPTRMFILEQGATAKQGVVFVDLYDSVRYDRQIRTGIWSGEVVISNRAVGYKRVVIPNFAVYGQLAIDTAEGADSAFLAGGTYTLTHEDSFSATVIFEFGNAGVDNDFEFNMGAGAYFTLPDAGELNKIKLGGEFIFSSADDTEVGIQLGARWMPREDITIDLLLYNNSISKATEGALQTPAAIRASLSF